MSFTSRKEKDPRKGQHPVYSNSLFDNINSIMWKIPKGKYPKNADVHKEGKSIDAKNATMGDRRSNLT